MNAAVTRPQVTRPQGPGVCVCVCVFSSCARTDTPRAPANSSKRWGQPDGPNRSWAVGMSDHWRCQGAASIPQFIGVETPAIQPAAAAALRASNPAAELRPGSKVLRDQDPALTRLPTTRCPAALARRTSPCRRSLSAGASRTGDSASVLRPASSCHGRARSNTRADRSTRSSRWRGPTMCTPTLRCRDEGDHAHGRTAPGGTGQDQVRQRALQGALRGRVSRPLRGRRKP